GLKKMLDAMICEPDVVVRVNARVPSFWLKTTPEVQKQIRLLPSGVCVVVVVVEPSGLWKLGAAFQVAIEAWITERKLALPCSFPPVVLVLISIGTELVFQVSGVNTPPGALPCGR